MMAVGVQLMIFGGLLLLSMIRNQGAGGDVQGVELSLMVLVIAPIVMMTILVTLVALWMLLDSDRRTARPPQ